MLTNDGARKQDRNWLYEKTAELVSSIHFIDNGRDCDDTVPQVHTQQSQDCSCGHSHPIHHGCYHEIPPESFDLLQWSHCLGASSGLTW